MSIFCSDPVPSEAGTPSGDVLRVVLAVALLLALTTATGIRNVRWQSLLSMWEDCARKSPNKSRTHNNLGNCRLLLGQHFLAIAEYQKAVMLDPGNLEAQYNLATTSDAVGMYNLALRSYEVFCRLASPAFKKQRAMACSRLGELLGMVRKGTETAK